MKVSQEIAKKVEQYQKLKSQADQLFVEIKEYFTDKVKVVFIGINGVDNCMHVAFDNGYMFQFWFSDIGKTIFLTKESAEAALKEMSE